MTFTFFKEEAESMSGPHKSVCTFVTALSDIMEVTPCDFVTSEARSSKAMLLLSLTLLQ